MNKLYPRPRGKQTANFVTGIRILGSLLLLFVPVFSSPFYAIYLICGLSDMVDGTIARKTNSASPFGAAVVCFIATVSAIQEGYFIGTGKQGG